jgi:hypothetical protein
VDAILKDVLAAELDPDTFFISANPIQDASILSSALLVDQTSAAAVTPALSSTNQRRTIAIVDRTADIDAAAKAIVTARFKFHGASPYSPDLVIVNEFVKDEFFASSTKYASHIFASSGAVKRARSNEEAETKKAFEAAEAKKELSKFGSPDFVLADITAASVTLASYSSPSLRCLSLTQSRTSPVTKRKVHGCYLAVTTSTSMMDSIIKEMGYSSFLLQCFTSLLKINRSTLLAAYLFAEASAAKFLAQHLNAQLTTVNQIPVHLLVGPAAPSNAEVDYKYRYSTNMFSLPRPQYISRVPAELSLIEQHISAGKASNASKVAQLRKLAVKALPSTGQRPGYALGFFEQGILLGIGLFLSVVVPTTGWGLWVLGKKVRSLM